MAKREPVATGEELGMFIVLGRRKDFAKAREEEKKADRTSVRGRRHVCPICGFCLPRLLYLGVLQSNIAKADSSGVGITCMPFC